MEAKTTRLLSSAARKSDANYVQVSRIEENIASSCRCQQNRSLPVMDTDVNESDSCAEDLAFDISEKDTGWKNRVKRGGGSPDSTCTQNERAQDEQWEAKPEGSGFGGGMRGEQCSAETGCVELGRDEPCFASRLLSNVSNVDDVSKGGGNLANSIDEERRSQADRHSYMPCEVESKVHGGCPNRTGRSADQTTVSTGRLMTNEYPPAPPTLGRRTTEVRDGAQVECVASLEHILSERQSSLGGLLERDELRSRAPVAAAANIRTKAPVLDSGIGGTAALGELLSAYDMECREARACVDNMCRELVANAYIPRLEGRGYSKMGSESAEDYEHKLAIHDMFVDTVEKLQTGQLLPTSNRGNLPKECVQYLKKWFNDHYDHPCKCAGWLQLLIEPMVILICKDN